MERCHQRHERFLESSFAHALADVLLERLKYERVEYSDVTRLWRGERELGDAYFGSLQWKGEPPSEAARCEELFGSPWFTELLGDMAGAPVRLARPPSPYLLLAGDRICLHDDMSDPDHCLSVTLGLCRDWTEADGGDTVVGEVASIEDLPTPDDVPFQLRRWTLTNGGIRLRPDFNVVTVLRLSPSLAHGVNPVLTDKPRLSLVALYAWSHERNET
jgi:hypothetical protein